MGFPSRAIIADALITSASSAGPRAGRARPGRASGAGLPGGFMRAEYLFLSRRVLSTRRRMLRLLMHASFIPIFDADFWHENAIRLPTFKRHA